jgi:hypothetical protein
MSSIIGIFIFLFEAYKYSLKSLHQAEALTESKSYEEQMTAAYFFLSSQNNIWVLTLAGINGFSVFGTFFLLAFQLRFVALGFTTQFGPPLYFVKLNKRMKGIFGSIMHRLANMYTFFCGSYQEMLELYHRQNKEHNLSLLTNTGAIPLLYPRDDHEKETDFPTTNYSNIKIY